MYIYSLIVGVCKISIYMSFSKADLDRRIKPPKLEFANDLLSNKAVVSCCILVGDLFPMITGGERDIWIAGLEKHGLEDEIAPPISTNVCQNRTCLKLLQPFALQIPQPSPNVYLMRYHSSFWVSF